MKKYLLFLGIAILCLSCTNKSNPQKTLDVNDHDQTTTSWTVGACEIITLVESQHEGNTEILVGATQDMLSQCAPAGTFPMATNAFLVRTPENIILIDAGYGKKLFDNMLVFNVAPEQVNIILMTHLHGDHIGGLLRNSSIAFPNAELYISQKEHDYWINLEEGGEQAQAVIEAYQSRLHLFSPTDIASGGTNILPEFWAIAMPGHTPGHTAFLLESDNQKMFIWGDLTHAMAIQMPYPEVAVTYDVDPVLAIATRKQALDYMAKQNIPVAGMHIPFPGIGHIETKENGYLFDDSKFKD